jgi:hypothetical protein
MPAASRVSWKYFKVSSKVLEVKNLSKHFVAADICFLLSPTSILFWKIAKLESRSGCVSGEEKNLGARNLKRRELFVLRSVVHIASPIGVF